MKVRFQAQNVPDGEDCLQVRYAPARRPRFRHVQWYLLMGGLSLALGLVVLGVVGGAWCS